MRASPIRTLMVGSVLCFLFGVATAEDATRGPSLIGIDHMPIVVENLEEATAAYERLGFALKPGRFHPNGLRNSHVKFKDGSGLELISPPKQPTDALTRRYDEMLRDAEGPAYISFHARDTEALTAALKASSIPFEERGGLITPADVNLRFIFFVQDNRSPTDKPEHFAHPNTAIAMEEVWLALDAASREDLRALLLSLGAVASSESVLVPTEARAEVFTVRNGRVVVVSDRHQLHEGRSIFGATFRLLRSRASGSSSDGATEWVDPRAAHGLRLRFVSSQGDEADGRH